MSNPFLKNFRANSSHLIPTLIKFLKFYLFAIMVRIPLGIDKSLRFTKRNIHTVHSYSSLYSKVSLETDGAYTPRCESWGVPILESNKHGLLGVDIGKPGGVFVKSASCRGTTLVGTWFIRWETPPPCWAGSCGTAVAAEAVLYIALPHYVVNKTHRIKIKPTKPLLRLTKTRIW